MKPIHVLSIGNSFSQDAHRYLHDLARSAGVAIEAVNLYIGGCSLERHYRNMVGNRREYMLEINGHRGDGFLCSMDEALSARAWDFITLQQASPQSFLMESYEPYLQRLAEHIRYMCPKAKLLLHQTWGYESGSERIKACGFNTYEEMFFRVKSCYEKAAADVRADGIIPSGEAFRQALKAGIKDIHRDTFHAGYGIGRFILAMTWLGYLTGYDVGTIAFHDFDCCVDADVYKTAVKSVASVLEAETSRAGNNQ